MDEQELNNQIERALAEEPDYHLPSTFADRLISIIEARQLAASKWEIFWITFAAFLFVVATGVVIYLTGFRPSSDAFPFLNNNIGLVVFGILFIGLLNWIDKFLLRRPMSI